MQPNQGNVWAPNRVLHAYVLLAVDVAREWQREHQGARASARYQRVEAFRKKCRLMARTLADLGVTVAAAGITPNYVLMQDRGYRTIYQSWIKLFQRQKIIDDLWAWQAETWTDFAVLAITLALDELDEAQLVAQSPISWRSEALCGRWFSQDRPIAVFWLRETGRIVEVQARPEAPGTLLTAARAHVALRITPAKTFSPEMCSMNMGSMNFSFHPLAKRYGDDDWKFDWEKDYVANSDGNIFRNTFRDIKEAADTLAPHDIKFEHECYDVGHLYNLKFCIDIGLFKAPVFIQFIFGNLGGIGPEVDNLVFMKRTADRLFGDDYRWSVLGAGGSQMNLATTASQMGGNVRVGLEDSLFISRGKLANSNAAHVAKIRRIVEDLGCEVATPDEAREILALKGGDRVNF